MKVFLSWSGDRSKAVALALREWLPKVIQAADPWMSEEDIEKGTVGLEQIAKSLAASRFGIICITSDNYQRPWLNYESGALSKSVDARVCTFILDLKKSSVQGPLGQFQATDAKNKEDTFKLVKSLNGTLTDPHRPVPEERLRTIFDTFWPGLLQCLNGIEKPNTSETPVRDERSMLEELLNLTRAIHTNVSTPNRTSLEELGTVDGLATLTALRNWVAHSGQTITIPRPSIAAPEEHPGTHFLKYGVHVEEGPDPETSRALARKAAMRRVARKKRKP